MDPLKYPSQILCLAQAIEFTENCEKAIKSATLPNFLNDTKDQLDSYTSVDLDHDETSNVLELKLKALILDTIHYGIENLLNLLLPNLEQNPLAYFNNYGAVKGQLNSY